MTFGVPSGRTQGVNIPDRGSASPEYAQVSGKNENAFKTFKKLFTQISDATEFRRLVELIKYLGNNTYNVNIEELKRIFA